MIDNDECQGVDFDLQAEIEALISEPEGGVFCRPNLVRLLQVIAEHIDQRMAPTIGSLDGQDLIAQHTASLQLTSLAEALSDLDLGITDPVLAPAPSKKTASRDWRKRREDRDLIEAFIVFQRTKGIKQQKAAAVALAKLMNETDFPYRNGRVKSSQLVGLLQRRG